MRRSAPARPKQAWNHHRFASKLVPVAFVLGAAMESFMVLVPVNGENFYDVAKRKRIERILDAEEAAAMRKAASDAESRSR